MHLNAYNNSVLMVTGSFPPEITGGGLQCKSLIEALSVGQHRFFVLTTCRDRTLPKEQNEQWGVIFRVFINPFSAISRFVCIFRIIKIFLKVKNKIKIIHLHGFSTKSVLLVMLAKVFKKKIIIKLTLLGEDDPISLKQRKFGIMLYEFYKLADVFISISPALTEAFRQSPLRHKSLREIPNAVNVERFRPLTSSGDKLNLRRQLKLPLDENIILFVGIFSKRKGVEILYYSWKLLRQKFKLSPYLVLVGHTNPLSYEVSPELVDYIMNDINDNDLHKYILLVDNTTRIEDFYQACDIFVLPTFREGLPNAMLEAMSSALPVIVTDIHGISSNYAIEDGHEGLIFKAGDTQDLASKLYNLLNNKEFACQLGGKARKKIEREFSFNNISSLYDRLYYELEFDELVK